MERLRGRSEEINGFNESIIQGHWIKGAELAIGLVLIVLGVTWRREAGWAICLGDAVDVTTITGGVALVIVACLGLIGALLRVDTLLWAHLGFLLLALLFLLSIILFTLEVTRGHPNPDTAQLSDFPAWFQQRVRSHKHWDPIVSSCFIPPPSLCSSSSTPSTFKVGDLLDGKMNNL